MEIQTLPLAEKKKPIEDESKLVFGKQFTDRMFVMEYDRGKGWHSARIAPYGPFRSIPAALVLHYSQEIFEGLKAFRRPTGRLPCFGPKRTSSGSTAAPGAWCMPEVDEAFFLKALKELVRLESDWVPSQ